MITPMMAIATKTRNTRILSIFIFYDTFYSFETRVMFDPIIT